MTIDHETYAKAYEKLKAIDGDPDWPEDQLGPRLGVRPGDPFVDPVLYDFVHGTSDSWRTKLKVTKGGVYVSSVENVRLILENDTAWHGVLAHNERNLDLTVTNPPFGKDGDTSERAIRDADLNDAVRWFGKHYGFEPGERQMKSSLTAHAMRNSYERVREYLESVTWDGTERLPHFLPVYFGAVRNAYTEAIGCRWMISAVARTLEPGCKADHVLVIEGDQGIGKSSALEILCGNDKWFGDSIPNIDNKDAQQYLGGMWIVELAEMDAATKAEASTLKKFITSRIDKYRPPYGAYFVNQSRRCVFAGTVNHDTYLKDDTGGRRFWCFASSKINLEGLSQDRDQLWAEAVARYRRGESWHLVEPELIELAQREQSDRREVDPWHASVANWLNKPGNRSMGTDGVSSADILEGALELSSSQQHAGAARRLAGIMRAEGWHLERPRMKGRRMRLWFE